MTTLLADRAYLSAEVPQRYELVDPTTGEGITSGTADSFGVLWLWEEPEGWDFPEVDTPMDRRPHEHGAALGQSTFSERVLSFAGSAVAPSIGDAHAARARLRRLLLSSLSGYLRYTHLDDAPAKTLFVRPNGKPRAEVTERWLDFAFVLVADDPIKQGTVDRYGPGRLRVGASGGLRSPLRSPLSAQSSPIPPTRVAVPNEGDEAAHAVYELRGPNPEPAMYLDTGEGFSLTLTLGASDRLVVDTRAGTVLLNGTDRYDAWGPGSVFPLIPPGGTQARIESEAGGADPAASLFVTTAPAWK